MVTSPDILAPLAAGAHDCVTAREILAVGIGEVDHIPKDIVCRALRVEHIVAIEVFGVGKAILVGAARVEVA